MGALYFYQSGSPDLRGIERNGVVELTSVVLLVGAVMCMAWWRHLRGERRNVMFIVSVLFALGAVVSCQEHMAAALTILAITLLVAVYVVFYMCVYHLWYESALYRYDYPWMGPIRSVRDVWRFSHTRH